MSHRTRTRRHRKTLDRARHDPRGDGRHQLAAAATSGIVIGYARCSTDRQDLTAQRQALYELGVSDERVYLDHGMTGRNRRRPGLE
jgi:Resolvase, N terminal domain